VSSNSNQKVSFSAEANRYYQVLVVAAAGAAAPINLFWSSNGGT
jgi:hypothetical protein